MKYQADAPAPGEMRRRRQEEIADRRGILPNGGKIAVGERARSVQRQERRLRDDQERKRKNDESRERLPERRRSEPLSVPKDQRQDHQRPGKKYQHERVILRAESGQMSILKTLPEIEKESISVKLIER